MTSKSQKKRQITEVLQQKIFGLTKSLISNLFGISRRNLYNRNTKQEIKDEALSAKIKKVLKLNPAYGHRRIALELGIGKRTTRRVMRLYRIKTPKRKARWRKRRDYGKPPSGYKNLIKGSCPIKPNVVFVGDFTRLSWNGKIIYLATFMDLYTREIVSWNISTKHTAEFVVDAFLDAVKYVGRPQIVHTDQGSEYQSKEYARLMYELNVNISMSKKASPGENGYQESFYNNFKTDLGLEFERFETIGELVEAIHQTIFYYNTKRIHTKLKMPPKKFKLRYQTL